MNLGLRHRPPRNPTKLLLLKLAVKQTLRQGDDGGSPQTSALHVDAPVTIVDEKSVKDSFREDSKTSAQTPLQHIRSSED